MKSGRLEAFSDGVIAIIITIMVLELKAPQSAGLDALLPLAPVFLSYVLSFIYVGIYWNNHHHMLHACENVTGPILWANLHLLFWLSLFPLTTAWVGENHVAAAPTALYGIVLLMAAIAYWLLQHFISCRAGPGLAFEEGCRQGLEKEAFAPAVRGGRDGRIPVAVAGPGDLPGRRADMVHSGPADRAYAAG